MLSIPRTLISLACNVHYRKSLGRTGVIRGSRSRKEESLVPRHLIQIVLSVVVWVLFKGNLTPFQKLRTCRLKNLKSKKAMARNTKGLLFAI